MMKVLGQMTLCPHDPLCMFKYGFSIRHSEASFCNSCGQWVVPAVPFLELDTELDHIVSVFDES